jgi:cell division control protein 6
MAFEGYCQVCESEGIRPLTQRRFSDMVSFMDLYGLINACVTSKGRYGKTREISASLPKHLADGLAKDRLIER